MISNPASTSCSGRSKKHTTILQDAFPPAEHDRLHDEHCLKMFQHALQQNDQRAKEEFQRHFSATVLGWLRLHHGREEAYRYKKEDYYVVQTFECFWRATAQYKELEFSTLSIVLRYLRASVNGVIADTLRNYSCSREVNMLTPASSREFTSLTHLNSDELGKNLQALLIDTRERRIAYLLFHCALEPGEIVQSYPQEFSDVREISRLRHSIIERLLRNS